MNTVSSGRSGYFKAVLFAILCSCCVVFQSPVFADFQSNMIDPEWKWGTWAYSDPHAYFTFDEVVDAHKELVINTLGSSAYLKTEPRPYGANCEVGCDIFTTTYRNPDAGGYQSYGDLGYVAAEIQRSFGRYDTYYQLLDTRPECPDGYSLIGQDLQNEGYRCRLNIVSLSKNVGPICHAKASSLSGASEGNPINVAIGNKVQVEVDYSGNNIKFTRIYNSHNPKNKSLLGTNWQHNYASFINSVINPASGNETVYSYRPDGRIFYYKRVGDDWLTDNDVIGQLNENTDSNGNRTGWRYTTSSDSVEEYDVSGKLIFITERNGIREALDYDSKGRLSAITDPYGRQISFSYNSDNRVSQMTDPEGGVYQYAYDGNNNLVSVLYPDNVSRQYLYENTSFPNALTGIIDENSNRYATWTYDSQGRAISSEHSGGAEKVTISYNADGTSTVSDSGGAVRTHDFVTEFGVKKSASITGNACTSCGGSNAATTYDTNGFIASRTDFNGNTTTYVNNARGLETSRTEAAGTPQARTITTEWHTDYRLPTKITRPSVAAGKSATTTITYGDATHPKLPTTITRSGFKPDGTAVIASTISLQYNADGRIAQLDSTRTDVTDLTTFTYYPNDAAQINNRGQLKTVSNALGHTVTYNSYDAHGNVLSMTDANGTVTDYSYDARQRLVSQTITPAHGSLRTTAYTYDGVGQLLTTTTPVGVTLTYTYDVARYLRSVEDNLGNRIEYGYDLKGNRTQEATKDPDGVLVRLVDTTYDSRDRVSSLNAAGSITQLVYDAVGNLASQTDPNDNPSTTHDYDALYRLMTTVDALSGTTTYDYDVNDRVVSVTAPNNAQTGYVYDDLGNLLSETSPDRGARTYSYDAAGNLVDLTDARNITVSYSYDALGRVTTIDYPGTVEDVSFVYDNATGCTNGVGRLCRMMDESGTTDYAYDAFGNATSMTHVELGTSYTMQYAYDAGNNVAQITYPDGSVVNYGRDVIRRISNVTRTVEGVTTTVASNFTYRADNLVTGKTFGNGLVETRSYDLQGRLLGQALGEVDSRSYTHDANGNIKTANGTAQQAGYQYDPLDRLVQDAITGQAAVDFDYDPNGNRTLDNVGSYDYLANSNRLQAVAGQGITLDAAGNTTSMRGLTLTYNHAGRLALVEQEVTTTSGKGKNKTTTTTLQEIARYTYNALGQRTRKVTPDATTLYHYDLEGQLIAESDSAGALSASYVWANSEPLAQETTSTTTTTTTTGKGKNKTTTTTTTTTRDFVYLHTDHLVTPRIGTDETGTVVWRWQGEAFGSTSPTGSVTVNLRFPGQYYDDETQLHYNWNRYYDPSIGRYITSDPIGLSGGLNTFGYVKSNPLRYLDILGLKITGKFKSFTPTITDWDYVGSTADIRNEGLQDKIGDFNFDVTGSLTVVVQCEDTGACGGLNRTWELSGSVSVEDVRVKIPRKEPAIPIPGMGTVILVNTLWNAGDYIYEYRHLITAAGKKLLNSPTLICQGSAFLK